MTKITALPAATTLTGVEPLPVVQSGVTSQATINQVLAYVRMQVHPGYVAGRYYSPFLALPSVSQTGNANSIRFIPFIQVQAITISELTLRVTTLAASGNFQLAIYASNPTTKMPTGLPLANTGDMTTSAAAQVTAVITQGTATIQPGLYYAAINFDATGATAQTITTGPSAGASQWAGYFIGTATLAELHPQSTTSFQSYTLSRTYASGWPDVTASGFSAGTNSGPLLEYKVSAVP